MSHDLKLERIIAAGPDVAFDTFTDPEAQKELYADEPDWVVESECDLRVGGRWSISFGPPGATPARETNVFRVVDRPRRLLFDSSMTMPDGSILDTVIEVIFEEQNGGTRMLVVQTGFPTSKLRDEFEGGWTGILDALPRVIDERTARS